MRFNIAFIYMQAGAAIAVPEWGGYWEWCNVKQTIMLRNKDGSSLDIRETNDVNFTMSFINRDDWVKVVREDTEHHAHKEGLE